MSDPWCGKIPGAVEQLSHVAAQLLKAHSRARELQLLKTTCPGACVLQREPAARRSPPTKMETSPCLPQQRPTAAKNKEIFFKLYFGKN